MIKVVTSKKPDSPLTLVVRRGALRRFNKLQQETANMPVVVTWDRRRDSDAAGGDAVEGGQQGEDDRRNQPSFTWELADFVVVPGDGCPDELPEPAGDTPSADVKSVRRR